MESRGANDSRRLYKLTHASAMIALLCGCAAVRTHITPEGDMVLVRDRVSIQVPTRAMEILQSRVGGRLLDPYVFAQNETTGITLSAALEEAVQGDCLEFHWNRLVTTPGFNPQNVGRRMRGQFQVVEYTLAQPPDPRFADLRLGQRNAIGCVTLEGTTAFLHVSKVRYVGQDERLFAEVFDQAHVESR